MALPIQGPLSGPAVRARRASTSAGSGREAGAALAAEIAANAPLAVQASKRMMRMGLDEGFSDHVHHVYLQLLPLMQTEDQKEGMAAFMEKREAVFRGR